MKELCRLTDKLKQLSFIRPLIFFIYIYIKCIYRNASFEYYNQSHIVETASFQSSCDGYTDSKPNL